MIPLKRLPALLIVLALAACATPAADYTATLNDPALAGTRWGLMVTTLDGRERIAINPDDRFVPASNTKLFTTLAVFRNIAALDQPDAAAATSLRIEETTDGAPPTLVLTGNGDATLGDGPQCQTNCLAQLADAVVSLGVATIREVVGDDRLFPDERWSPGWSWNNLETRSGTAISALTVNDNELALYVSPGATPGAPAFAKFREGDDLYALQNEALTVATGQTDLWIEHRPNTPVARLYGQISIEDGEKILAMGIDDPALHAATRLRRLLVARGLVIETPPGVRRRAVTMLDDPAKRDGAPAPRPPEPTGVEIARLTPAPLIDDLRFTLKVSQNLHAELMLRRLGLIEGTGSAADGLVVVEQMLTDAGLPRNAWDLSDGSGMSTYNRISPRAMTQLLRWTQQQPWAESFRSALPGSGEGTLSRRFRGTALDGKIFAKTGSLNAVNALAGFMIAASGETLVFAAYANDRPSIAETATQAMDAALLRIAAAN